MREPEPLVPKPRQNTGHLPAADTVTGSKDKLMAPLVIPEVSHWRSDRADSALAGDEISVLLDRLASVSPQLFQCREVDSISSSASDWCTEMSCNTVRYAGCTTL